MGDMLRKAYGGGFAPYEYMWPDEWEGDAFDCEDDFPTADEMRSRKKELSTADKIVVDEIANLLNATAPNTYSITYEGYVSSSVVLYLRDKGYSVDYIRRADVPQTMISW